MRENEAKLSGERVARRSAIVLDGAHWHGFVDHDRQKNGSFRPHHARWKLDGSGNEKTEGNQVRMQKKFITALVGAIGAVGAASLMTGGQALAQADDFDAVMELGETVFFTTAGCAGCHGNEGQGGFGPEFAGNEYLDGVGGLIGMILGGFEEHGMPAFADTLTDEEVAAVATFVRNSFGNAFEPQIVNPAWVATRR